MEPSCGNSNDGEANASKSFIARTRALTICEASLRIIVTGLIAQHPLMGGVTWDYLQYLIGLQQLGHDVYYLEDSGFWPYNIDGGPSGHDWAAADSTFNITYLAKIMERFGLRDKWAYYCAPQSKWLGLSDIQRGELLDSADLLLNVSGTLEWREEYRRVQRLAYIDSDPVFTQIKLALGAAGSAMLEQTDLGEDDVAHQVFKDALTLCDSIGLYDVHFSFGEQSSALMTETNIRWHPTRQPIALLEWEPSTPFRNVFTTVMNWTSYEPMRYQGRIYGQKDVEFKRFLDLPQRVPAASFEVALSQIKNHVQWESSENKLAFDPPVMLREDSPAFLLARMGWHVVDPMDVCHDMDSYRSYIGSSMAEWSVAKNGYVVGQPGWFSCRSACYLASGRPVVVQDTGYAKVLPVGEGIIAFTNLEEAVIGVQDVQAHYKRHSQAARAIAETYFDSRKVLSRLVNEAMQ
jgi:hypothetical protein